ncbi:DNA-directed RNA polymerase V subunit 5C [Linum perenne]
MENNSNNAVDGGTGVTAGGGGSGSGGDVRRCLTEFAEPGSVESLRYFLSRRTVFEMLNDRGYDVSDAELTRTLTEFRSDFDEKPEAVRLRFTVSLRSDTRKKVLVLFMGDNELKTAVIRTVYKQILGEGLSLQGLILILEAKATSHAKKVLDALPFKVEVFKISDLIVNISKHVLQPRYEVLTAKQKELLLKKYMAEDKQLPRMLQNDAIVKYYGLEKERVVKMSYKGGLVDSMTAYRCVW